MFEGWSDMLQDTAQHWAKSAVDHQYNQQFQLQKMAMQQYGPNGAPYMEGQPGGAEPVVQAAIPQSWLFIGGIVALVLFMGD
jgi:hypothetical protein